MVGTQFNRFGRDADQEDAIEGESVSMSVPSVQWQPASIDQRAEMERQLATTTFWQLCRKAQPMTRSMWRARLTNGWVRSSQISLSSYSTQEAQGRRIGDFAIQPQSRGGHFQEAGGSHASGDCHYSTPDGEKATCVAFWVKPLWLPKRMFGPLRQLCFSGF